MTDKEKAEEYENLKNLLNRSNIRLAEVQLENAELKKQIPQWHDLRKNPNDLPKDKGEYEDIHKRQNDRTVKMADFPQLQPGRKKTG